MKNFYVKLFALVTIFFVVTSAHAQCTFRIQLRDSYGDGWNGGVIQSVQVDGVTVLSNLSTANGTGWTNNGTFTAYGGQAISITYASGTWCWENSYRIQINNGGWSTIYTSGTCPTGTYTITSNGCSIPYPCSGTSVTLNMTDSYGDGWNGGSVTLTNNLGNTYGPYTINSGNIGSASICLPDACYSVNVNPGNWPGEMSWSLSNGVSGDGYYGSQSNVFALGSATCGAISGCTDPASINYDPLATIDDGSCVYPPTNDPCASATPLPCGTSNLSGTTVNAVAETAPFGYASPYGVWYTFTGNGQQTTITTTASAGFDHEMTILSGSCGSFTFITSQDVGPSGGNETYTFTTVSGVQYYVYVAHWSTSSTTTGAFTISSTCVSPLPADPTGATASSASICSGSSTTLTATGVVGTAYWFEGSCATSGQIGTGSTLNVSPTTTTTYYVRNNDGQWSANCASVTVTVNPMPTANAGADQTICAGSSVVLSGAVTPSSTTGSQTFTWSGSGYDSDYYIVGGSTSGLPAGAVITDVTYDVSITSASGTSWCPSWYSVDVYANGAWQTYGCNGAYTITALNGLPANGQLLQVSSYDEDAFSDFCYITLTATVNYSAPGATYAWTPAATLSNASILNPLATPTSTTTYTLTATSNGCSASDDIVVTVDQPSTAATGITGTGSGCLGTTSTLSVQGGSLSGSSNWEWYEGSCGGTVVGTGNSITVTPGASTTYYVAATANGACPATACVSGTITLPTPSNVLSGNNITATCTVNQNGYIHLLDSNGDLVASINSNGQNLGTVTATSYIEGTPLLVESCGNPGNVMMMTSVMDRHWVITTQNAPTGPVSVLLPFTDNEAASLNLEAINNQNPDDNVMSIADIGCTKYSGPNEDNLFDNDCTSNGGSGNFSWHTQTANGQVNTYLAAHPSTNKYITIDVNSFSEFWLHGSANNAPLPVELTSFQANCLSNSEVEVSWSTASEYNSSHYIISKSYDGINWEEIKIVQAAGMSQTNINYAIIDQADPKNRTVYYSLNQYDLDGISKEFKVTKTTCSNDDSSDMIVYPNPGNGVINLKIVEPEYKGVCQVIVSDLNGSILIEKELEIQSGTTTVYLNGIDLTPGLYMINYLDQGGKLIQTIKYSKM